MSSETSSGSGDEMPALNEPAPRLRWASTRLRRAASCAVRWLEPAGRRVGTRLLKRPRLRTFLNAAYERPGILLAMLVTRLLPASTVTTPFIWRARLPSGVLLMPVTPELQRSWTDALVWRWPPNLPMRRLYRAYLACRGAQGTLLDVGANDGSHSWLFSLAGWRCIAFEPQPDCVAYLQRIAALNGFTQLAVEESAVGDRPAADANFYVSPSSWFSSVNREHVARFENPDRISVKMITLDAYCQENRVTPNCIKIDVEGYELRVLRGATDVLARTKPDLVVEVSADRDTREGVWKLLVPLDYRVYEVARAGLRPILTLEAFRAAGSGDAYIDALFTDDVELGKQLGAKLNHP
jgi:FkbM family methyltransferase